MPIHGTPSTPPAGLPDEAAQVHRLGRFLTILIGLFCVFIPLDFAAYVLFRDPGSLLLTGVLVVLLAILLSAKWQLSRGRLDRAVSLIFTGILAGIPFLVLGRPLLYPVLALGAVMPVAVALPFARHATMRRLVLTAYATALVTIALGMLLNPPPGGADLPPAYRIWSFNGSLAFVIGLVLFMMWKFADRLNDTLAATRDAHAYLAQSHAELDRASRFKTQFMNNAAHELNTPLTPIRLQLHLLQDPPKPLTDEQRARAMSILDRNIGRVEALVQDLLDASRVQARRLRVDPEPVDVADLLREAHETFREPARLRGIHLGLDATSGLTLHADPLRVGQVLYAFINNALKFTPVGGEIVLSCQPMDDQVVLSVHDTGVGVSADDLPGLFQPFSQVGPGALHPQGTGLGLYIARGIAELHGGRVWCESPGPGRGSTFHLALPITRSSDAPAHPAPRPRAVAAAAA